MLNNWHVISTDHSRISRAMVTIQADVGGGLPAPEGSTWFGVVAQMQGIHIVNPAC
jgi:hypothetical protein